MADDAPLTELLTLWCKRTDLVDADYFAAREVSPDATVDEFKARWLQNQLQTDTSRFVLLLVCRGEVEPTPAQEQEALNHEKEHRLNPRSTLRDAGITEGSSLLVTFKPPRPSEEMQQALRVLPVTHAAAEEALLDPWNDIRSDQSSERKRFCKKVLKYYYGNEKAVPRCMITGVEKTGEKGVVAAHIWPFSSRGRGLERFGLYAHDVHDARNGLLLIKTVEEAIDAKRAGFFCGANDGPVFVVLDPKLNIETVYEKLKFSTFANQKLLLPGHALERGHYPRRRLLAWHFSRALLEAQRRGWLAQEASAQYLEPSANDKVLAWLEGGSPQATWPGAAEASIALLRTAGTVSASSDSSDGGGSEADGSEREDDDIGDGAHGLEQPSTAIRL